MDTHRKNSSITDLKVKEKTPGHPIIENGLEKLSNSFRSRRNIWTEAKGKETEL